MKSRAEAGLERLEVMLLRRRLQWLGHVVRMSNNCILKCMLVCKPEGGKCVPGGQRRRWVDLVMADMKTCAYTREWLAFEAVELAT